MIQLANAAHPPLHLSVGKDVIALYRNNAAKVAHESGSENRSMAASRYQ
jgi:hypothetical protein